MKNELEVSPYSQDASIMVIGIGKDVCAALANPEFKNMPSVQCVAIDKKCRKLDIAISDTADMAILCSSLTDRLTIKLLLDIARDLYAKDIITVLVYISEFSFTRESYQKIEKKILTELLTLFNTMICIPKQAYLMERFEALFCRKKTAFDAYMLAAIRSLTGSLFAKNGLILIDVADIRMLFSRYSLTYFEFAESSGENKADIAFLKIVSKLLMKGARLENIKKCLVIIDTSQDITAVDLNIATDKIEKFFINAQICQSVIFNDKYKNTFCIYMFLTHNDI